VRLVFLLAALTACAEDFEYSVWRVRLRRDEPGRLRIGAAGVSYQADRGKTRIEIALEDIHEADVSDARVIRIETYDIVKRRLTGRRVHTFRLREGQRDARLAAFFAGRLPRPVAGAYPTGGKVLFEVPVYHRHRLGGCHGTLRITSAGVEYAGGKAADSRTWPWEDIEATGSMNRLHFRVNTLAETFNFDLKQSMPEEAGRLVWEKLHGR